MIPNNTVLYLQSIAQSNGHQRAENVHQATEGQSRDRDRDTQLNIRLSSELEDAVGEEDERLQKSEKSMKHKKTENQLTWTPRHHRDRSSNQEAFRSLTQALCINATVVQVGVLIVEVETVSDNFACLLDPIPSIGQVQLALV